MSRTLLVEGTKTFKLTIPDDARITFGPWSPPKEKGFTSEEHKRGTLRIYQSRSTRTEDIIDVFSGVTSFRDITAIEYSEQVIREEGATIWKSDKHGYERETKARYEEDWIEAPLLTNGKKERHGAS